MWQTPHPFWYDYMWKPSSECSDAKLVMKTNQVIDLTENFKDGVLTWNAPKGKWVILRTAMRPTGTTNAPATPEATGYETDKMSKKHIASHFDAFLRRNYAPHTASRSQDIQNCGRRQLRNRRTKLD